MKGKVTTKSVNLKGVAASGGIAIGRVVLLDRSRVTYHKAHIHKAEVAGETDRLRTAVAESAAQLGALQETIAAGEFQEHAKILEAHQLMLQDDLLVGGAEELIGQELINAEWAVMQTLASIKAFFNNLEDEYFRERQTDVDTVGNRIMQNLTGQHQQSLVELVARLTDDSVLVAQTLTPADTLQLHQTARIQGFCTEEGTRTAHTAIIARSLEIPAVVGVQGLYDAVQGGDLIVMDGDTGEVCIAPTKREQERLQRRHRKVSVVRNKLNSRKHKASRTQDDFEVTLAANLDLLEELDNLQGRGGQGIGLFRTEYLFLNRRELPTEAEQFLAYREVLKRVAPSPATIRTLDIGGDKLDLSGRLGDQLNPFFGQRAIRYCLREGRELFRTQLRALLRASVHGTLQILVPFISDIPEIREVKALIAEVRAELASEGQKVADRIALGAMIEIPAAALIADLLAREVDFFSVGTNDLIQYTLAISRDATEIGYMYHPLHPAMLRLLRIVSDAAHTEGIPLNMCGEMAGEPLYAPVLIGYRFNGLSMSAPSIPVVREVVQRLSLHECRALVDSLRHLPTWEEVEAEVKRFMAARFADLTPLLGHDL